MNKDISRELYVRILHAAADLDATFEDLLNAGINMVILSVVTEDIPLEVITTAIVDAYELHKARNEQSTTAH